MPGPLRTFISLAAAFAGASMARAAPVAAPDQTGTLDRIAELVATPSDLTLFGLGVAGVIVGRLVLGRRRPPRRPLAAPRADGD